MQTCVMADLKLCFASVDSNALTRSTYDIRMQDVNKVMSQKAKVKAKNTRPRPKCQGRGQTTVRLCIAFLSLSQ